MRKSISFLLIVCMIFSMTMVSFADKTVGETKEAVKDLGKALVSATEKFGKVVSDINGHWAQKFIEELIDKAVIGGYPDGTFKPNANIKVTEFTVLILKSKGIEIPKTNPWYQGVIDKAMEEGIIQDGEFDNYERYITRGEMARMIVRATGKDESFGNTKFSDDNQISLKLKGFIKGAVELGIINGYPDKTFRSKGNATRAEASTMITKMLKILGGEVLEVKKSTIKEVKDIKLDSKINNSEHISTENFEIKDSKIYFDGNILKVADNPNINEQVIKVTNALVDKEKYVAVASDYDSTVVELMKNKRSYNNYYLIYSFEHKKQHYTSAEDTQIVLEVAKLFEDEDYFAGRLTNRKLEQKLENSLNALFESQGDEIFSYIIDKYKDDIKTQGEKYKGKVETKKFGKITVTMYNDELGGPMYFYFNMGN